MKRLVWIFVVFFSFILTAHAAGHHPATNNRPINKIHNHPPLGTAPANAGFSKAAPAEDDALLFLAEDDFSIDKYLYFPALFLRSLHQDYRLQQQAVQPDESQIRLSELITRKLPIYLLHHTLRIPYI
ncbi:hypothetical protein [Niabella soli]|uniref:Uncharacterized protein n=1 Tax=Niabella soli DSM 19437 TaxID=929713 RepID=W0F252_9BACT|nr:hypothetical protein [Niabella soli]AHF17130.1 hypothetical protein NIASO_02320 [Niabella soli DSM 19437]